jgi:hypothetical protein
MFCYLPYRLTSPLRSCLRCVLWLLCVAIAIDGSLRAALVSMQTLAARTAVDHWLTAGGLTEMPAEEVPSSQESNGDGQSPQELSEEVSSAAVSGERRGKRLARLKPASHHVQRLRSQRVMQVHSGWMVVFEYRYRNGCGAHLRC